MSSWMTDVRHAARVLWKNRSVSAVAFVTLALAIGANTAIFTVVNALLVQALPYPEPDRLVHLARGYPNGVSEAVSIPKFVRWMRHEGVFEGVAAYDNLGSGFNLVSAGPPDRVTGSRISSAFFPVIAVAPMLGRPFTPDEDLPGGARAVVLSHQLWERRFASRREIVGQAVTLNGEPYTVVGVMPAGFRFPDRAELWVPFQFDRESQSRANYFEVVARLRPGVPLEQARAAMHVLAGQIRQDTRDLMGDNETIAVRPLRERLYGDMRPALLVLLAAVGFVLLIACVNVANLQLAQVAARRGEMVLRTALGASPRLIVRQLLVESVLLALAAGVAGVLLAYWTVPVLLALNPADVPGADRIVVDIAVLGFALGVAVLAGVGFGLLPAWQVTRTNLDEVLREGAHRSTGGRSGTLLRRALVAGEVALALVLTIGASLLVKSLAGLTTTDPGFVADHVLTMKLSLPESKYGTGAALGRFQEDVEARIRAIPGVRAAALAIALPLELGPDLPFTIEGRYVAGTDRGVGEAQYRSVGPDYFGALQIPVRRGRLIERRDRGGAVPVAVVNEAASRRFWPGEDAVGQRITLGQPVVPELADATPREIVGVVGDVREQGLGEDPPAIVYIPLAQQNDALTALGVRLLPLSLVVRADAVARDLIGAAQREVWEVDPEQPVTDVRMMQQVVARSLGPARFNTVLLGALAALALLLAAVGVYGVLSHLVGQQTREIGVRMALGATERRVLALFLQQGFVLVGVGLLAGMLAAVGVTRFLRSLLLGISATDPWVFAAAPVLLTLVALVAIVQPALRAARIDPVNALRTE